ncbi:MAG: archaeosortase A [Euryarchaeota archaeon]|nr:archaeosortase A [Euryarchaeota archaeon]
MEFDESAIKPIIGLIGMIFLGISFFLKNRIGYFSAPFGWILVGMYFGLSCPYYIEINDPVLILMTGAAPFAGLYLALYEVKGGNIFEKRIEVVNTPEHLIWLRGMIFFAGTPYLLVSQIPYLNRLLIIFIAIQVVYFMKWTGAGDIKLGDFIINTDGTPTGQVTWETWSGNKWWLFEQLPENGMFVELINSDGSSIGINFVLACTALQSIIVFVGAILAVNTESKGKIRALIIIVPLIHVLNLFRNAGLIWMHSNYPDWEWFGISIFDFGHSYASKVLSLFAMFLMALVIFEIMPKLHTNVLKVIDPFLKISPNQK